MVLTSIVFFVAFLSFNPSDPSFNNATSSSVSNLSGNFGAFYVDPILQILGYSIIIPILFLLIVGTKYVKKSEIRFLPLRITAMLVTIITFSLSITILGFSGFDNMLSGGGYLGSFLASELGMKFNKSMILYISLPTTFLLIFFAIGISFSEFKTGMKFVFTQTVIFIKICLWLLKVFYKTLQRYVARFSKIKELEPLDEVEQTKANLNPKLINKNDIEIVDTSNLKTEKKAQVQSFLKLDPDDFEKPSISLLKSVNKANDKITELSKSALNQNSKLLAQVLEDFGIKGEIVKIHPGPVVTLYEFEPAAGIKSSRIIGLADDISRSMSAVSSRIAVIPGKSSIGIELPNTQREVIYLKELLETNAYQSTEAKLPLILGKNIAGNAIIADLAKMPHLLVAGTTGSGKSVAINTMILSLLYKYSPKQCKFIMIDPKMLELSVYQDIPHLLAPVVTDPKKAISALRWVVKEMESRYKLMSTLGVRNIEGFNKAILEAKKNGKKLEKKIQVGFNTETGEPLFETVGLGDEPMPFIVIIVDEMADLMLTSGKEIEGSIQRLAQMARAAGIHLIMATQRPSVDVVTGVIKANFPTRISFQVTSKIDSRTILGEQGAEQLLGMGDMLFMSGGGRIERVHGPFVADKEVESIAQFLKSQSQPEYISNITKVEDEDEAGDFGDMESSGDELYDKAVNIVLTEKKASTSYIQRSLRIGYNRAANLIEKMEKEGVVGPANHVGKREILVGNDS